MFKLLKVAKMLRITNAVEDVGMDLCKTGGSAYSFEGNGDPALGSAGSGNSGPLNSGPLGNGRPARSGQAGASIAPHYVHSLPAEGARSAVSSGSGSSHGGHPS